MTCKAITWPLLLSTNHYLLHIFSIYCYTSVLLLRFKLLKIFFFLLIFTFSSLTHTPLCCKLISISKYNWSILCQERISMLVNWAKPFTSKSYLLSHQLQWITAPFLKHYLTLTSMIILYHRFPCTLLIVPCLYLLLIHLTWSVGDSQGSFQGPFFPLSNISPLRWFNHFSFITLLLFIL